MATLDDIHAASSVSVSIAADPLAPPGTFTAAGRVVGVHTTYLLRGDLGHYSAQVLGRIEDGKPPMPYLGGGLKGGSVLMARDVQAAFAAMNCPSAQADS